MLSRMTALPTGILKLAATELHTILDGPTLIHLEGHHSQPIFISVLLHGNEHTGWEALRKLLQKYQERQLPRSLLIFIGNVEAAKHNQRFISGQKDFNRMWGDSETPASPLMSEVLKIAKELDPFFSVDIHNNTGKNPHYACINKLDKDSLYLASLFSKTVVYFIRPESVQSMAFSKLCPAVTIECGLSGQEVGTQHVMEFLDGCIHINSFPSREFDKTSVRVFHTVATFKIPAQFSVGFGEEKCDINFHPEIEFWNFKELDCGVKIADVSIETDRTPIEIITENGQNASLDYFELSGDALLVKRPFFPAMITKDLNAIRKDCFCYLMEEFAI